MGMLTTYIHRLSFFMELSFFLKIFFFSDVDHLKNLY